LFLVVGQRPRDAEEQCGGGDHPERFAAPG
jgi:hypothetical protein